MRSRRKTHGARRIGTIALAGILVCLSSPAQAQSSKVEITVAAVANGAVSSGTTRAELLDPSGNPVTLFEATHRTTRAIGVEGAVGIRLTPAWSVEVSGAWSRPGLESRITDDFEGADPQTATLGMHRFTLGVGAVRRFGTAGRLQPYVTVAAGWVRELTVDRALVDDGVAAYGGGGLKYRVREGQPGWLSRLALRTEVRLVMRRGGITLGETGTRWSPSLLAGLVIGR